MKITVAMIDPNTSVSFLTINDDPPVTAARGSARHGAQTIYVIK